MRARFLPFLVAGWTAVSLWGQSPHNRPIAFPPLTPPLYVSGTFGELRNNHFHAGIDLRTNEVVGKPVFAVQDGFVSRIKVSPIGYGLAIYLDHPSGHTSVYAHLDRYDGAIAEWVLQTQMKNRFWELDTLLPPGLLSVTGGERIATSGNSGGSAGPHVHFELRETQSEHPLNPLLHGLEVVDDLPPVLRALFFQDALGTRKQVPVATPDGRRLLDTVSFAAPLGVVVDAEDRMQPNGPKNGLYKGVQKTSNAMPFGYCFDFFDFADGRAVNATHDAALFAQTGKRMYRMYRQPYHPGPSFSPAEWLPAEAASTGRIYASPGETVRVVWRVEDVLGQSDSAWAYLRCVQASPWTAPELPVADSLYTSRWSLAWGKESFYRKTDVSLREHSDGVHVQWTGPAHTPLRLYPVKSTDRIHFLVWTTPSGKKTWMAWDPNGSKPFLEIKESGSGKWQADLTPPSHQRKNPWPTSLAPGRILGFTASDAESGMAYYGGELEDGTFVPVSYDAKYKSMRVSIPTDLAPGAHRLEVVLKDRAGNVARLFHSFQSVPSSQGAGKP